MCSMRLDNLSKRWQREEKREKRNIVDLSAAANANMDTDSVVPFFEFLLEGVAVAEEEVAVGISPEPYRGADWERTGRAACVVWSS